MDTTPGVIRIVVADDHPILRDGVQMLLGTEPDFQVVGEASDGVAAVEMAAQLVPDILLLDLSMPRMGGLDVLRALSARNLPVRTVVLAAAIDRAQALAALEAGARGVMLKEAATTLLYRCIRCVMAGEYWVGRDNVGDLIQALRRPAASSAEEEPEVRLTPRERSVVAAVAEGLPNLEVARRLNISEQTVKNHLQNIFDKVGVSSRVELAVWALERGLVPRNPPGSGAPPA